MPATIGVNSHSLRFFKMLSVRPAAKVCENYHVPFNGPACSLFWIAADARRRIQLALHAKGRRSVMARYHAVAISTLCIAVLFPNHSSARDNGQFANSPLKQWFD